MELRTRRVHIAGITREPWGAWMQQIGRDLTGWDGFLEGKRYLILDRDSNYTAAFRRLLKDSGVKPVILPRRSPDLDAFAERWVLTARFGFCAQMWVVPRASLPRTGTRQWLR